MPETLMDLGLRRVREVEAQALEKLGPCVATGTQGKHSQGHGNAHRGDEDILAGG